MARKDTVDFGDLGLTRRQDAEVRATLAQWEEQAKRLEQAHVQQAAAEVGMCRTFRDAEGNGGEVTMRISRWLYHKLGNYYGYQCWQDADFCAAVMKHYPETRVVSKSATPTIVRPDYGTALPDKPKLFHKSYGAEPPAGAEQTTENTKNTEKTMKTTVLILAVITSLLMLAFSPPARASSGYTDYNWYTTNNVIATGLATTTNNASVTATTSSPILSPQNQDVIVQLAAAARAGAGPSNEVTTIYFNTSVDGTNYTTTYPISVAISLNGATLTQGQTVVNRTNFTGTRYFRVDKFGSTHTNIVDLVGLGIGTTK